MGKQKPADEAEHLADFPGEDALELVERNMADLVGWRKLESLG